VAFASQDELQVLLGTGVWSADPPEDDDALLDGAHATAIIAIEAAKRTTLGGGSWRKRQEGRGRLRAVGARPST
jgi:hypothetical protein